MDYRIIRSKRTTCAIHVLDSSTVEVRCPAAMSDELIARMVEQSSEKIAKLIDRLQSEEAFRSDFKVCIGDMLPLCGEFYELKAGGGAQVSFDGKAFNVPASLGGQHIKPAVVQLYKLLARRILSEKTAYYAEYIGVSPKGIGVTNARKRFGSCSGKGRINYAWRLIMADEPLVDYVVVHELTHLLHLNHSSAFWSNVQSIIPDYKMRHRELMEFSRRLNLQDWD